MEFLGVVDVERLALACLPSTKGENGSLGEHVVIDEHSFSLRAARL